MTRCYNENWVQDTLAGAPYRLFFAKNGAEALRLVADYRPAVVITNWEMPDFTGVELCAEMRRDQDHYTYIILLTSNTEKEQVIRGLAAGADDYLTKPFHSGELLARVAVGRRIADLHRQVQAKSRLLEQLALTDPLTGLANRRAVKDWGIRELQGAARHGFPFWVALADLDRFKTINDTYGHSAGDAVLKRFAELLRTNTRASNLCGRIGGEEFVMILTHGARSDAAIAVDRIRRSFEAELFTFGGSMLGATASFGISGFQGSQAPELSELLQQADTALYAAKRGGRNRVEFADSTLRASAISTAHS